jgi:hypothetical protein
MKKFTTVVHWATVTILAIAVLGATGVGFAQSWAGLYGWALEHRLHGWKAQSFPAMVDLFIAIGELGLFKLAIEGHRIRKAWLPWLDLILPLGVAVAGWAVSLAFNVGHVGGSRYDQVTAAVPPIASMLGLFVLLRTLHRIITSPAIPAEAVGQEAAVPLEEMPMDEVADEDPNSLDEDGDPAQRHLDAMIANMKLANEAGVSQERLAELLGTKRHKIAPLIKKPVVAAEPEPADEVNGYELEPA